jgi:AcrR family transcriptional regulator
MRRLSTAQSGSTTRDRILNAAIHQFSRQSYETVGLRDIAADARVDVAYVHRCFGSKEKLFAETLAATLPSVELLISAATNDLAGDLAKHFFAPKKGQGRKTPLDIIHRSLSSPDASRVIRDFVRNDFIDPLSEHTAPTRAAVIAALVIGMGILRDVLQIDLLLVAKGGDLEQILTHTLKGIMAGTRASRQPLASEG